MRLLQTAMGDKSQRNRGAEAGFTLLEILLVVIIISMLVGVAVVNLAPKIGESKITAAPGSNPQFFVGARPVLFGQRDLSHHGAGAERVDRRADPVRWCPGAIGRGPI